MASAAEQRWAMVMGGGPCNSLRNKSIPKHPNATCNLTRNKPHRDAGNGLEHGYRVRLRCGPIHKQVERAHADALVIAYPLLDLAETLGGGHAERNLWVVRAGQRWLAVRW